MNGEELVDIYVRALTASDRDAMTQGRLGVIAYVGANLRDPSSRDVIADILAPALETCATLNAERPTDLAVLFELGQMDAIVTIVNGDPVQSTPIAVRRIVTENPTAMKTLRALRGHAELVLPDLRRNFGLDLGLNEAIETLRGLDLVHVVNAGKTPLIRLTAAGEDYLDLVERGLIR